MEIIRLLELEHQRALALLEQVEALGASVARDTVMQQLFLELALHERAEEDAVWSVINGELPDGRLLDAAIHEEADMKQLIQIIEETPGGEKLPKQIVAMRDMLMRHLMTEQERLFPLMAKHLDDRRRRELGAAYLHVKTQLMIQGPRLSIMMMPESLVEERQQP